METLLVGALEEESKVELSTYSIALTTFMLEAKGEVAQTNASTEFIASVAMVREEMGMEGLEALALLEEEPQVTSELFLDQER